MHAAMGSEERLDAVAGAKASMTLDDLGEHVPRRLQVSEHILEVVCNALDESDLVPSEPTHPVQPAADNRSTLAAADALSTLNQPVVLPRPSSASASCRRGPAGSASAPFLRSPTVDGASLALSPAHSQNNIRISMLEQEREVRMLEEEEVVTADEACVNVSRRSCLRDGTSSASQGRVLSKRGSAPQRPVGAVLDREERKLDSKTLVQKELEQRERELAKSEPRRW